MSRREPSPTGQPLCHETPVIAVRIALGMGVVVARNARACACATGAATMQTNTITIAREILIDSLCIMTRHPDRIERRRVLQR